MPRVVSGKYRGTHLDAPKGENTRPTSDKVKEALFSIIQTRTPDARFLDLFAGSGQMGIEALSRGASEAVFVEYRGEAAALIRDNIRKVHAERDAKVISADISSALRGLGEENRKFDLIFLDPPYAETEKQWSKTADLIGRYGLLEKGGMVIIEHSSDVDLQKNVINLTLTRRCKYGLTLLTFFTDRTILGE